MHDRPRVEDALVVLRGELEVERSAKAELTTRAAWLAYVRFARQRFDGASTPDSDGLLVQYGTYRFSGRPMFTVDLARQFDVNDDSGEHRHYVQIHCELRYERDAAQDALGGFDSWFFLDTDAELAEWLAAIEGRLEPLLARVPSEIDVYEETV